MIIRRVGENNIKFVRASFNKFENVAFDDSEVLSIEFLFDRFDDVSDIPKILIIFYSSFVAWFILALRPPTVLRDSSATITNDVLTSDALERLALLV